MEGTAPAGEGGRGGVGRPLDVDAAGSSCTATGFRAGGDINGGAWDGVGVWGESNRRQCAMKEGARAGAGGRGGVDRPSDVDAAASSCTATGFQAGGDGNGGVSKGVGVGDESNRCKRAK